MDSMWEYNAPQYVDFTNHVDDGTADAYFDVDHEVDIDNQLMNEKPIVKLLEDSVLSDTMCVNEEPETESGVPHTVASPMLVDHKVTASNTPRSEDIHSTSVTSSVRDSHGNASVSAYEDALAELSCTKTPVLPTRSRATPLRRSARKAAESAEDTVTSSEDKTPSNLCTSPRKWRSTNDMSREARVPPAFAEQTGISSTTVSKQDVESSDSCKEPSSTGVDKQGNMNQSSVKRQGLRSRTRSLDNVKTVDVKLASAKDLHQQRCDAKVARSRCQSEERDLGRKPASTKVAAAKPRPQMKLTIPHTPQLLKRELKFLHAVPVQSSEQQEMAKIRELRRALADKRRLAEESRVKALVAPACSAAMRSAQPLTEPERFQFATDERLKAHGMETRQDTVQYKEISFSSELRHYAPMVAKPRGPTLPQPFHLTAERKRKLSEGDLPCSKFESVAEKVIKFSSKTPERFRKRPSPASNSSLERKRKHNDSGSRLTVPKTPNLETRQRLRPNYAVSQTDREEMELQEAKKHQFRAKPVNHEIFANSTLGIRKVVPRECTVPEEFHMETEERVKQRPQHEEQEKPEEFEFHARPLPKAMLEGPVGIHPPKPAPLTVPQSPAFALKRVTRATAAAVSTEKEHEQAEDAAVTKARPVPHTGIPFQPRLEHHTTDVMPFSFAERDKEMFARKEEKIKAVWEEERKAREFRANPIPLSPALPRKRPQTPTKPVPFLLEVDARGAVKAEENKKQREEETQKLKDLAVFKARFPNVLASKPFVPAKSNRPLTEIRDIQLNTDRRAGSRLEWEKWKHEKEMEAVMERCARDKLRKDVDAAEAARARADAVHKAQPVRHYRPVDIHPSSQLLTKPESPNFSERLRSRMTRH